MNDIANKTPISFLLSQEELILIINLLNVGTLPGLGQDPLGKLNDEQKALSLMVAERALRARQLAVINPENKLLLNGDLLDIASTCAYAQSIWTLNHLSPTEKVADFFSAYSRDSKCVAHMIPQSGLHLLTSMADIDTLFNEMAIFISAEKLPVTQFSPISIKQEALEEGQKISKKDAGQGSAYFQKQSFDLNSAKILSGLLNRPHHLVTIHHIIGHSGKPPIIQTLTLLYDNNEALVMKEPEQGIYLFEGITPSGFSGLMV